MGEEGEEKEKQIATTPRSEPIKESKDDRRTRSSTQTHLTHPKTLLQHDTRSSFWTIHLSATSDVTERPRDSTGRDEWILAILGIWLAELKTTNSASPEYAYDITVPQSDTTQRRRRVRACQKKKKNNEF